MLSVYSDLFKLGLASCKANALTLCYLSVLCLWFWCKKKTLIFSLSSKFSRPTTDPITLPFHLFFCYLTWYSKFCTRVKVLSPFDSVYTLVLSLCVLQMSFFLWLFSLDALQWYPSCSKLKDCIVGCIVFHCVYTSQLIFVISSVIRQLSEFHNLVIALALQWTEICIYSFEWIFLCLGADAQKWNH